MTLAAKRAAIALGRTALSRTSLRYLSSIPRINQASVSWGSATSSNWRHTAPRRWYSPQSLDEPAKVVTYEDVLERVNKEEDLVVDTREPEEYAAGHIPGAVNIPFRSSPGALGLEPQEFEETFGFSKPSKDKTLIFYCQGGVRSSGAEQLAATYGYKSRLNYKGSMGDWVAHNGPVDKPKSDQTKGSAPPTSS